MGCGCGKTREQRLAERQERAARILAAREEKARIRAEREAAQRQPEPTKAA